MKFWHLCLILIIVFNVIFSQYYKIAADKSKNDGALTSLIQFISGVSLLLYVPFFKIQFPADIKIWIFFGLSIIFYTISDRLQTPVRKNLEASINGVLGQLYNVFMLLWGITIFKEEIVFLKVFGAAIIVFCNALLFYEKGKFRFNKYVVVGLFQNLCMSIAISFDVGISNHFNIAMYLSIAFLTPAILIALLERIKFKAIKDEFKNGNKLAIIITGVCWGLSGVFSLSAYNNGGTVTTVAP